MHALSPKQYTSPTSAIVPGCSAPARTDMGLATIDRGLGRNRRSGEMLVEIGHFALVLALLVALVQAVVPLAGAAARNGALMMLARPAALAQFGLVALSFAIFVHAHIVSDFSVKNVYENSSLAKPMLYKVTGAWGSHEGSMLLWLFMLALFGGLVARFGRALPASLRARTLAIQ